MFLLGLAMLVYGYRLFLVMLPIWGFFMGLWLGADTTSLILGTGFLGTVTGWVVGFTLGLILAVLSYLFYGFAVALQAALIGYSLSAGVMSAVIGPGILAAITGLVFAVIVMILTFAFNLQKYIVIVITSLLGANTVLLSFLVFFGRISLQDLASSGSAILLILQESWLWLLFILVIAGAGIWSQIRANRKYKFQREYYVEGWG